MLCAALGDVALLDENTFSPLNVYVDLGLGDGLSDLLTPGEVKYDIIKFYTSANILVV